MKRIQDILTDGDIVIPNGGWSKDNITIRDLARYCEAKNREFGCSLEVVEDTTLINGIASICRNPTRIGAYRGAKPEMKDYDTLEIAQYLNHTYYFDPLAMGI